MHASPASADRGEARCRQGAGHGEGNARVAHDAARADAQALTDQLEQGPPPTRSIAKVIAQNNLISRLTKTASATESTIDQTRQPGMKRTRARSPDRFQITNIAHRLHVGFLQG
jgi:hypothetical protein